MIDEKYLQKVDMFDPTKFQKGSAYLVSDNRDLSQHMILVGCNRKMITFATVNRAVDGLEDGDYEISYIKIKWFEIDKYSIKPLVEPWIDKMVIAGEFDDHGDVPEEIMSEQMNYQYLVSFNGDTKHLYPYPLMRYDEKLDTHTIRTDIEGHDIGGTLMEDIKIRFIVSIPDKTGLRFTCGCGETENTLHRLIIHPDGMVVGFDKKDIPLEFIKQTFTYFAIYINIDDKNLPRKDDNE